MTGLRVFILSMTGFAMLCLAGFMLLDASGSEEAPAPPPPLPPVRAAAVVPVREPVTAPIPMPKVQMPAIATEVAVREPPADLPLPPHRSAENVVVEEDPEAAPPDVLTEAPRAWEVRTRLELTRLFNDCREIEGASVEGPVEVAVEFVYEPNILDGPAERQATASIDDPYLAACLSDSLWDAVLPDLGAPADFLHRMSVALE